MNLATVGVVIPTFNNLAELKCCLDSLCRQVFTFFEVFVCVDGSTDGTLEWLENPNTNFPFKIHVLTHPNNENRGRQATRNLALKQFNFPIWLFLDSDVYVESNWVLQHRSALKKSDISIGRIQFTNTENPWAGYYNSRGFNASHESRYVSSRYFISGNAGISQTVFKNVGFFDENIRAYGGDAEFALRLLSSDKDSLFYDSKAVAKGIINKTIWESLQQYELFFSDLLPELMKKYPGNEQYFNYQKIKKLARFMKLFPFSSSAWAKRLDNWKRNTFFSRFLIRMVLTIGAAKAFANRESKQD